MLGMPGYEDMRVSRGKRVVCSEYEYVRGKRVCPG